MSRNIYIVRHHVEASRHACHGELWVRRYFRRLGPGLVTGASDDDPGAIATYSIAGASRGFGTLWTAIFTLPLMTAVELTCARIGLISGTGLTGALKHHSPRARLAWVPNREQ